MPSSNGSNGTSPFPPAPPAEIKSRKVPQHGVKGVFYAGDWVDMEDLKQTFHPEKGTSSHETTSCDKKCHSCPRSKSRNSAAKRVSTEGTDTVSHYDVVIVGAGCVGSSIARTLSRYDLSVLLLESADDVSQGATKGNSGIVHAGYDDTPGSLHAKYCWKGNQMFAQLDRELRFGYQKNGSLVLALNDKEVGILEDLKKRGETNGVERLRILNKEELFSLEPAVNPDAIAALYSPDAGNVIPYEFAIAMAENAVDNGVEVRIRREVVEVESLESDDGDANFAVKARYWEPREFVESVDKRNKGAGGLTFKIVLGGWISLGYQIAMAHLAGGTFDAMIPLYAGFVVTTIYILFSLKPGAKFPRDLPTIIKSMSKPLQGSGGHSISIQQMLTGGSGSPDAPHNNAVTVATEVIKTKYIVNAAGGFSDKIANMIGDASFTIKPRLGDYLLLNRNQGYLTTRTLFPCPDPVLGKGVLVQTTLWGNLILGPTARDSYKPEAMNMTKAEIQQFILSKCHKLMPYFDPRETFHAFCGARAKSSRGDWIIEPSASNPNMIHVAGIDSPGLAGSPAIAEEVVRLLSSQGLELPTNHSFNPNRSPIITPKAGMRGLKLGPVGKNDSDGTDEKQMAANVICKCEKVTELEVVRALRRSLPIDSSQGIRKRTRAGMGHCQGEEKNYNCEMRVRAIIARENGRGVKEVGGRPWPATSTLRERWIGDEEKEELVESTKGK